MKINSTMCKYRQQLAFEWSHHRILSADSKVKVTLQNSIKHSGSERVKHSGVNGKFLFPGVVNR